MNDTKSSNQVLINKKIKEVVNAYPEGFSQAKEFSQISEEKKKFLIEKAIIALNRNPDSCFAKIDIGNTFVLVSRIHEEDGGGFTVSVATNYEEYVVNNEFQ